MLEEYADRLAVIEWHKDHGEIPIVCVVIYLAVIFYLPQHLPKSFKLRKLFAAWNLLLSGFSLCGAYHMLPYLLDNLMKHGFKYTVCTNPEQWMHTHQMAFLWSTIFVYSKIPELLDTTFLVLQKKPVIFLHWFHHATVLLYCWHSFHHSVSTGTWFCAMNYCVHAVMYFYYFLAVMGYKKIVRPAAPFITAVQLLQMVVGIIVTCTAASVKRAALAAGEDGLAACYVDNANYKLGLMMYVSYFILFAILFFNLYCTHKQETRKPGLRCPPSYQPGCDVGDAAGFFHGRSNTRTENELKETLKKD